jgi:hypothetical protein
MGATPAGKFSCDGCGKSYTWKSELAGRRVKCKCGQVMTVPKEDPAAAMYEAPPEGFDDLYALAEEKVVQEAPAYFKAPPVGAPAGGGGGGGARGGGRPVPVGAAAGGPVAGGGGGNKALLGYASMGSKRGAGGQVAARGDNVFWSPVWDLYVPAGLILLGMFLSFFEIRVVLGLKSFPVAIGAVGVLSIVNVVFGFAGILIATKLLDLGLGPIPVAVLKTAAAAILPAAAASLINNLLPFGGFLLAWFISFGLSLAIFMKLMDLDYFETMICTVIIWLVRTWVGYAILGMIFHSMSSGGGGGTLLAAAGGTQAVAAAAEDQQAQPEEKVEPGARYDRHARMLMSARRKPDAKAWVADPNHALASRKHDESVKIVDDLTKLGAQFMVVPDPVPGKGADKDKETGNYLVFFLPTEKDARQKIFEYYPTLGKVYGLKNVKDEGQQYMSIHFARSFFDDFEDDAGKAAPGGDDEDEN